MSGGNFLRDSLVGGSERTDCDIRSNEKERRSETAATGGYDTEVVPPRSGEATE